jgi:hypothetical protein
VTRRNEGIAPVVPATGKEEDVRTQKTRHLDHAPDDLGHAPTGMLHEFFTGNLKFLDGAAVQVTHHLCGNKFHDTPSCRV